MKDKHSYRNGEVVCISGRGGYQDSKERKWVKERDQKINWYVFIHPHMFSDKWH